MKSEAWDAGETVVVSCHLQRDKLGIITKITPSGIINVESGEFNIKFNSDGWQRGGGGYGGWSKCRLKKSSIEKIEEIKKEDFAEKIKRFLNKREQNQILEIELGVYEMMAAAIDRCEASGKLEEESS